MKLPERIGRYRVARELGRGGMAAVFLAEDDAGETVVIKRMLPAIASQPQARDLFRREAKVATLLRHPHIVRVRELIEDDGELALVMEYLEGLSLRDVSHRSWLNGKAMPLEPLVQAMIEAALALHHAHHLELRGRTLTVVHRDVSPDNLVLTTAGVTKLIDFGVAKPDQGADLTVGGQLRGKPSYMSPEQVKGGKLDGRSDLWGLGVSFFYLFTGRRPFKRDSTVETMRAIVQDDPPSLTELNPRIPREVAMVVRGLLVKDAERRTSTGAEVAAQLTAVTAQLPRGYLPAGRLLAAVEDLDDNPNGKNPPVAAMPSLDWSAGARLPEVSYESTRLVDPSSQPTFIAGGPRVALVGALELPEEEHEDEPELGPAVGTVETDPEPSPLSPAERDELAAQATVLLMRDDLIVPPTEPSIEQVLGQRSPELARTQPVPAPRMQPEVAAPRRPVGAPARRAHPEVPTVKVPVLDDDPEDDLPRTVLMQARPSTGRRNSLRVALFVGALSFAVTAAFVAGLLFGGVVDVKKLKLPSVITDAARGIGAAPEEGTNP